MAGTSVPEDEKRRVEADFMQRLQEQMQQLSVYDHLVGVLQTLSSLAFQHLGVTRETVGQRDLDQSRLAIDAFRALTDVLVPLRPSDEVILYRSTLSQMQLAYVAELERGPEPKTATGSAAPQDTDARPAPEPEAPAPTDASPAAGADEGNPAEADAIDDGDTTTTAEAAPAPADEEER
jgi:hypothetical protein